MSRILEGRLKRLEQRKCLGLAVVQIQYGATEEELAEACWRQGVKPGQDVVFLVRFCEPVASATIDR